MYFKHFHIMHISCMWLRQHAFMHFWHGMGQRFPYWLFLVTGIYLWFFVAGYIVVQLFHFVINRCTPATACHTLNSWLSHGLHGLVSKCTFAWGFCCWKNREGQDFIMLSWVIRFSLIRSPKSLLWVVTSVVLCLHLLLKDYWASLYQFWYIASGW